MVGLEDSASAFASLRTTDSDGDVVVIPGWGKDEWATLFSYASEISLAAGATLIQREEADRTLYFVASGLLEATVGYGDQALGILRRVYPGSAVGEVAFFDGLPRSARVWAVQDSKLLKLDFSAYTRFAAAHVQRANELLFALGRLVAVRLRYATIRAPSRP